MQENKIEIDEEFQPPFWLKRLEELLAKKQASSQDKNMENTAKEVS